MVVAALVLAVLPFHAAVGGFFGYTPLNGDRPEHPLPDIRKLPDASCSSPVLSVWHSHYEDADVNIPGAGPGFAQVSCSDRARHRLVIAGWLLVGALVAGALAFRMGPKRTSLPKRADDRAKPSR